MVDIINPITSLLFAMQAGAEQKPGQADGGGVGLDKPGDGGEKDENNPESSSDNDQVWPMHIYPID